MFGVFYMRRKMRRIIIQLYSLVALKGYDEDLVTGMDNS